MLHFGVFTALPNRRFHNLHGGLGQHACRICDGYRPKSCFLYRGFNFFPFRHDWACPRGGRRIVTNEQLIECFSSFITLANAYSPDNPEAIYVIDELEINPFAFTDYMMVPLDGMCRFSKPGPRPIKRPYWKIDRLLHPKGSRKNNFTFSAFRRPFSKARKLRNIRHIPSDCYQARGWKAK